MYLALVYLLYSKVDQLKISYKQLLRHKQELSLSAGNQENGE